MCIAKLIVLLPSNLSTYRINYIYLLAYLGSGAYSETIPFMIIIQSEGKDTPQTKWRQHVFKDSFTDLASVRQRE